MELPHKKRSHALAFCATDREAEEVEVNDKLCHSSSPTGALTTIKPVVPPKKRCNRRSSEPLNDDLPSVLASLIEQIKSSNMDFKDVTDAKIILEKKLTESDTKDDQARLAIPALQTPVPFLTFEEETFLMKKTDQGKNTRIHVKVIMCSSEYNMYLSRWNYHDNKNKKKPLGWKYVLHNKDWNKLRQVNKLQTGDIVRVVSFRCQKTLNFAILGPRSFRLFGKRIVSYPW